MSGEASSYSASWGSASWDPATLSSDLAKVAITDHQAGFERPAGPSHPRRRRVLVRASLILLLFAALTGGGVYWKSQAPARAQHRLQKALVGAQAAWPGVAGRLSSLPFPDGWTVDPTFTACALEPVSVTVCLKTDERDPQLALSSAVSVLEQAGASTSDPLMDDFVVAVGASRADVDGCVGGSPPSAAPRSASPVHRSASQQSLDLSWPINP